MYLEFSKDKFMSFRLEKLTNRIKSDNNYRVHEPKRDWSYLHGKNLL